MTHTNQGRQLDDFVIRDGPEGTRGCYGWRCVGTLKTARNSGECFTGWYLARDLFPVTGWLTNSSTADNIAMLGTVLKIWSLKHWVNQDGQILPL